MGDAGANQPIIIDTNFWLLPFERRINILGQLERMAEYAPLHIVVPMPVYNELKVMAGRAPNLKNTRSARSALVVIEKLVGEGKAELFEIDGPADGAIISSALQKKAWVATNDKLLRSRLKAKKVKIIVLRDEHMLGFF